MFRCIIITLLLTTDMGCTPERSQELSKDEVEQIKETMRAYRQAWINNDSATVLNTISTDVVLFVPGSRSSAVSGKAKLKNFWFPPSDIQYPIKAYEISDEQIFGSGLYATAQGTSLLIWDTVQGDSIIASDTSKSQYLTILRKEGARWRIFRQMYQMKE